MRAKEVAGGVVAGALLCLTGSVMLTSSTAAPTQTSVGRSETCVLDGNSGCTKDHGFGVKPSAIVATHGGTAIVSVPPGKVTANQYRIDFRRHDGARFAAGTPVLYFVHYDFDSEPSPSATPTASPTPTLSETPSPSVTPSVPPDPDPSPVKVCDNPSFTTVSDDNIGDGRTFGEYFVHNNMWNNHSGSGPPGTYTMNVCNYDNWYEVVTQAPSTVSPGAVRAYPNVHKDYNDVPLTQIRSADFAAKSPRCAGCVYNVAFDVWIGNDFDNELMIWTENFNQRPAGTRLTDADQDPANGSSNLMTIGGKTYQVWKSGGATSPGGIFTYVAEPVQTHGTMPLDAFFADLERRNWINGPHTTWQVDFGVETVSTAGTQQRFDFTDFEIHEN